MPKPPLTLEQLALEGLLTRIRELQIGESLILPNRADDGLGGLVVKRHSRRTYIFQREGFVDRSRWADDADEERRELATYLATGKLNEPEEIA